MVKNILKLMFLTNKEIEYEKDLSILSELDNVTLDNIMLCG